MNIHRFNELSFEEQRREIRKQLYLNDATAEIRENVDHSDERHKGITPKGMIERAIKEGHTVTEFNGDEEIADLIERCILENVKTLSDWINDQENIQNAYHMGKDVRKAQNSVKKIVITWDSRSQIGHGITDSFDEKVTNHMKLVLEWSNTPLKGLPFDVITAYPDIEIDKAITTNKDFGEIAKEAIKRNPHYACRAYWCAKQMYKGIKLYTYTSKYTGKEEQFASITIRYHNNNRYKVNVEDNGTFTYRVGTNEKNKKGEQIFRRLHKDEISNLPQDLQTCFDKIKTKITEKVSKLDNEKRITDVQYDKMCEDLGAMDKSEIR